MRTNARPAHHGAPPAGAPACCRGTVTPKGDSPPTTATAAEPSAANPPRWRMDCRPQAARRSRGISWRPVLAPDHAWGRRPATPAERPSMPSPCPDLDLAPGRGRRHALAMLGGPCTEGTAGAGDGHRAGPGAVHIHSDLMAGQSADEGHRDVEFPAGGVLAVFRRPRRLRVSLARLQTGEQLPGGLSGLMGVGA